MKSIKQIFDYMNDINFPYVVLRNWENLPHSVKLGAHSDLDLLVYDIDHWCEIFPEAKRVYPKPRVQFRLPINQSYIQIDVRHLGDGYYPLSLQESILNNRVKDQKGFYTPNSKDFLVALAYHVAHHKNTNTYKDHLGSATPLELLEALKNTNVGWEEPTDPTVGRHNAYFKGATSIVSKNDNTVEKRQTSYNRYDLIGNELSKLSGINSKRFPKVISSKEGSITFEDCGETLSAENLPDDWIDQLKDILVELRKNNIQHRDIKPDNLMVKDGVIKLIDFGWSRFYDENTSDSPSCLGYPYKPSYGFDDNFSMRKVIKELEFKREEIKCAS